MSDKPERIWTDGFDYSSKPTDTIGRTEYVRADLAAARIAELEAERDEAINQLDSARHSVDVLERRVAALKEKART